MSKQNTDISDPKVVTKIMLRTLWSTTWRIFLPVSICFAIGLILDLNTATKPWGMIVGAGLGIIIALCLVFSQLKHIRNQKQQATIGKAK
ncbi:MAG: AtpZ/AtpI family protein [Candidatus Saccharibacteria bacterium]|nr:AtpZ/AtpI family protein [Candidatus Saccharibacteria bacterium]